MSGGAPGAVPGFPQNMLQVRASDFDIFCEGGGLTLRPPPANAGATAAGTATASGSS